VVIVENLWAAAQVRISTRKIIGEKRRFDSRWTQKTPDTTEKNRKSVTMENGMTKILRKPDMDEKRLCQEKRFRISITTQLIDSRNIERKGSLESNSQERKRVRGRIGVAVGGDSYDRGTRSREGGRSVLLNGDVKRLKRGLYWGEKRAEALESLSNC